MDITRISWCSVMSKLSMMPVKVKPLHHQLSGRVVQVHIVPKPFVFMNNTCVKIKFCFSSAPTTVGHIRISKLGAEVDSGRKRWKYKATWQVSELVFINSSIFPDCKGKLVALVLLS